MAATDTAALIGDFRWIEQDDADVRPGRGPTRAAARDLLRVARRDSSVRACAHEDPAQLAGQLLGRLDGSEFPTLKPLLAQLGEPANDSALPPSLVPDLQPPSARHALLRTLQGHSGWVRAVAVTPDGRRAISASDDQTLRVWDLDTGKTVRTLQGHADGSTPWP